MSYPGLARPEPMVKAIQDPGASDRRTGLFRLFELLRPQE